MHLQTNRLDNTALMHTINRGARAYANGGGGPLAAGAAASGLQLQGGAVGTEKNPLYMMQVGGPATPDPNPQHVTRHAPNERFSINVLYLVAFCRPLYAISH